MRLERLYIGDYRVLRDLEIHFEPPEEVTLPVLGPDYALDFLVGVNGTGKSTVLRALSEIFRRMDGDTKAAAFPFDISYRLASGEGVSVTNIDPDTRKVSLDFWLRRRGGEERVGKVDERYLPTRIVAFTTGSEAEWEISETTEDPDPDAVRLVRSMTADEREVREIPGLPVNTGEPGEDRANRQNRLLFIRASQLTLVTLCGLLADLSREDRRLSEVLREAKVGSFKGFSLRFRTNLPSTDPTDHAYVEDLARHATRALRLGSDRLLVFDLAERPQDFPSDVLEEFDGGLSLFETLARLATPAEDGQASLREVNLFVERYEAEERENERGEAPLMHLFDWLSDGERSFVGRMCLFSLLGATEALVLLDEPEVHFNDYWKRQIVKLIDGAIEDSDSHVLITTHSSIVLTDVPREDIVILNRGAGFTDDYSFPGIKTFASDPSDVMVHVFGAPQATGAASVQQIQEALERSRREPNQDELRWLFDRTGPGYWSYRIRRELARMENE
ncbi:AAA family ATPase [Rubrobacter tropicus]|uniref:AAA family ATPase n=1 Tax=Rubrobacter tropicus TaxID=2653851 RepID=A0A6G8Q535_9ACTN|nr:AAA family ATPase [Rubrobacter tropicus]QIN81585.1 AAA family ATPase [Rubrobacter tropicus]